MGILRLFVGGGGSKEMVLRVSCSSWRVEHELEGTRSRLGGGDVKKQDAVLVGYC